MQEPFLQQHRYFLLSLALLTLAAFGPMLGNDFVNFDDPEYTYETYQIRSGVTSPNVLWSLDNVVAGNWHPVTIWSLQLNATFAQDLKSKTGLSPFPFLFTNLLLHVMNVCLLYVVIIRLIQVGRGPGTANDENAPTDQALRFRAWFVAALFAVHPLHVESVAWISERKDVLSIFFGLLTILAYLRQLNHPSVPNYVLVVILFLLGLMSKSMLVTLPCVLLLLDFWPLGRLRDEVREGVSIPLQLLSMVVEKIPLFVLTVFASAATIYAQKPYQHNYPLEERTKNAVVSYMNYLGLTFWPSDLAIFYPLSREAIPYHLAGAALLLLLAITAIVFTQLKSQPYLAVGWFWYLGTLVPVIGLIQVGSQSMADRYTYLPHIGLFLALVWGVAELVPESMRKNAVRAGLLIVSVLVALTFVQVGHWRDSITLWTQAVRSVPHASFNLHKLGESYDDARSFEKAEEYYQRAIDREGYPPAAMNLALLQYQQGRWREAEVNFHIHAKQRERRTQSRRYLGKIGLHLNEYDKAIENLEKVVEAESARFADTQLPPTEEAFDAAFDLALAYFLKGEPSKGLEYLEKTALAGAAAQIISRGATPGALRLVATLGWLSAHSGQQQRATKSFEILDDLTERDWREAFLEEARGLANLDYDRGGNPATAVGLAHLVCEADPEPDARHLSVLGLAYLRFGQPRTALQYLEQATTLAKAKQDKELLEILEKLTRDARHE